MEMSENSFIDRLRPVAGRVAVIAVFVLLQTGIATAAGDKTSIPVPKNVIFSGQIINEALLRERQVPVDYVNRVSVLVDKASAIGMVARVTLMPNQPIFTNNITEPDVVKVNRPTVMEYISGSLRITAEVLPLVSAKKGEYVRARNIQSGSIVSGTALADGSILVRSLR